MSIRSVVVSFALVVAFSLLACQAATAQIYETTVVQGTTGTVVYVAPAWAHWAIPASGPRAYASPPALFSALTLYFSTAYPPDPPRPDLLPLLFTAGPFSLPTPVPAGRRR